ncbi:MAG: efflux RND transporter periplasmic adaptor subunit [Elusimicrobia bacterium]|nr:efflux RND transporter periplasmic adaptor subunit [Elusimicrobiota bacterium]
MKKIILPILVVGIAAWAAVRLFYKPAFRYAGTVEATEVDLSPRLAATIAEVTVKEGQDVKKDDVLVRLDGEDIKIAAEQADTDFRRAARLLKSGSMTQEAFDRAKFHQQDAALHVEWLTIKSPLDGTVLDRFHEPGELVSPPMKLLRLANLNDVWAQLYVPQTMLAKLSLGMKVPAYLPELDMKRLEGTIVHIRNEAEFTPKNVQTREERARLVYAVKVAFDNKDRLLKPGMTIEAELPDSK